MRSWFGLALLVCLLAAPSASGLFVQDPQFPECLGPEDPFCPNEPGSGGSTGGGSAASCDLCERVPDLRFYSGGVAFCQKITVSG